MGGLVVMLIFGSPQVGTPILHCLFSFSHSFVFPRVKSKVFSGHVWKKKWS